MAITILRPTAAVPASSQDAVSDEDDDWLDADGDADMEGWARGTKRPRRGGRTIITPGEVVTDDPQWMRGHGTYQSPSSTIIRSTLSGTLLKTNKLLSISPLRARYTPEVGDLVVGRVVEVQSRRWRVDIASTLTANLAISAINLPGGTLRRRTAVDELNIRTFFTEGDLVVAEVRELFSDGSASLHTRSLRYGKLRNGCFLSLSGTGGTGGGGRRSGGGGGGVVRSRRQVFTLQTPRGGGEVDVILGVNGYVWVAKHVRSDDDITTTASSSSASRLDESANQGMYASENEHIGPQTRKEIARIMGVIRALAEGGRSVDEEMVVKGYEASLEVELEMTGLDDKVGSEWMGGEKGRRTVQAVMG